MAAIKLLQNNHSLIQWKHLSKDLFVDRCPFVGTIENLH